MSLKTVKKYRAMAQAIEQMTRNSKKRNAGGDRAATIARMKELCYQYGGKPFLADVQKYGCNERGMPIRLTAGWADFLEAIGDIRIPEIYIIASSQSGKTTALSNFNSWLLTKVRVSTAIVYPTKDVRDRLVKQNPHIILGKWAEKLNMVRMETDTSNNTVYAVSGANCNASYVSTSTERPSKEGLADVGGALAGFTADAAPLCDELSQWPVGTRDVVTRRMDASVFDRLPPPFRGSGTPGSGAGIERLAKRCQRHFYQHSVCGNPECGKVFPVDPKGTLFRPLGVDDGGKPFYTNAVGRFEKWWNRDPKNPVETAYFACPHCGSEIGPEQRVENVFFQCIKTGEKLRDFLNGLTMENPIPWRVVLHLSPVCSTKENLAVTMARESQETDKPYDFQEQGCGHPSENAGTQIDIETIEKCMGLPLPERRPDVVLAGIDQGTSQHWMWISRFWLPQDDSLNVNQKIAKAIEQPVFVGDIRASDVKNMIRTYGVNYGICDNEDNRSFAREIQQETCLEIADQKPGYLHEVKKATVFAGGEEIPCWNIRNELFQDSVMQSFLLRSPVDNLPLMRLGPEWRDWIGDVSPMSPVRHLTSMAYDRGKKKWVRPDDHVDDLFFARMFVGAALYLWLIDPDRHRTFSLGGSVGLTVRRPGL